MKLIIAGSRDLNVDIVDIEYAVRKYFNLEDITQIVCGGARGPDKLGEEFAERNGIPTTGKEFYVTDAEWKASKGAGHARNARMADYGDVLLLIWDEESGGSLNMRNNMIKRDKIVIEVIFKVTLP